MLMANSGLYCPVGAITLTLAPSVARGGGVLTNAGSRERRTANEVDRESYRQVGKALPPHRAILPEHRAAEVTDACMGPSR